MLVLSYGVLVFLSLYLYGDLKTELGKHTVKLLLVVWLYIAAGDIIGMSAADIRRLLLINSCIVAITFLLLANNILPATHRLIYKIFSYTTAIVYPPRVTTVDRSALQEIVILQANRPAKPLNAEKQQATAKEGKPLQFTSNQIEQMNITIKNTMSSTLLYLQHGFTLDDLAKATNIQAYLLSAFINKCYKMNFNDFVNLHRVEYFKKKVFEDEKWRNLTLEGMARESGFGDRNTFTIAFKKFSGITPAQFLKLPRSKDSTPMHSEDHEGTAA